jgi:Flp pilus assembly protein TadG
MKRCRGLLSRSGRSGASSLEFALAVTPLMLLLLGIIDSGLVFWDWQAIQGTATAAARCAAIDASACKDPLTTPANTQNYAVTAAQLRGLPGFTTSNVTVSTGSAAQALCGGTTASVVTVGITYSVIAIQFVHMPSTVSALACFPLSTT